MESLGILAGGLAHDFNNLLTAIMGNLSLAMISEPRPDDKILRMLHSAEAASQRAREITQQLMAFSRGGAPAKEVAAIENIIRETAEFCLRGSNCRCAFSLPPICATAKSTRVSSAR